MHGELRTKDELSLTTARVETYAGMVFATFDQEAPPLREWLGPMTWYFDLMFDKTPEGMTSIGAPQRFTLRANWKSAAEQFGGDIFHSLTLHRSMQELGLLSTDGPVQEPGLRGVSICHNGHFAFCFDFEEALYINALKGRNLQQMTALERLKAAPPPSLTADMVDRMVGKFSEDQLRVLATFPPQVGSFFPNIAAVSMAFPMSDGSMSGFCTWRAWVPRGPESFEMFHWTVVERNAPQAMRDAIRMTTANIFGISGWVEADDTDTWPTQTKNSVGTMGRRQKLRYQAIAGPGAPPGWPGPGQTYSGFAKDDAQWNFWLQYLKFMNGRPW
jgi:phenylpropionate dioxygenase-like ring-hydroxylating dioxygenase large terminal subunit